MDNAGDKNPVASQYEHHPYPDLGLLGIFSQPHKSAGHPLAYEFGQYLRTGQYLAHDKNTRILVAGCGTYEPIVVAKVHPKAHITAMDFSTSSLERLKRHAFFNGLSTKRLQYVHANILEISSKTFSPRDGKFDYILCTGVLHHSDQPGKILKNLSQLLKPTGVLRIMTYAKHSRYWIYELQEYFRKHGLTAQTPNLLARCREVLFTAPDPLPAAFETYSDIQNTSGLIDGFFHALDRPLTITELSQASELAHLKLLGFGHAWHSQPGALVQALEKKGFAEIASRLKKLNAWSRLEFTDLIGELSTNPVFWLARSLENVEVGPPQERLLNPALKKKNILGRVRAPLFPTLDDETPIANPRLVHQFAQDADKWAVAGWLLGKDGKIPRELFENRAHEPASKPLTTNPESIPQKIQTATAMLFNADENSESLTKALKEILEPRIDAEGKELHLMSFADWI